VSTSAPARLTSYNLLLSELEDSDGYSPFSSVVNVELHMGVGPETFAYELSAGDVFEFELDHVFELDLEFEPDHVFELDLEAEPEDITEFFLA
jgi:hypothetical protein